LKIFVTIVNHLNLEYVLHHKKLLVSMKIIDLKKHKKKRYRRDKMTRNVKKK